MKFQDIVALKLEGVATIHIRYYGSDDSGTVDEPWANKADGSPFHLPAEHIQYLEDWTYGRLEEEHSGWEINDGADGHIIIDLNTGQIQHEHTDYERVGTTHESTGRVDDLLEDYEDGE